MMDAIAFQAGDQLFRMLISPDMARPDDKNRLTIESLEIRVSGAFVDISGLIDVCRDDLLKLKQVDVAMARRHQSGDDREREAFLFDRTEASAINAEACL